MSSIEKTMDVLCREIGPRPTGSENNRRAADFCAEQLRAFGYAVELQEFPCFDWNCTGAALRVDGRDVDVTAAEYSLPCQVSGPLVCAGTIEELRAATLDNAVCVLHSQLCAEPLMPKSMTFWNPEEHQEIIRLLEEKKPLAVITVSFLPDVPVPIIQDGDFTVPCAAVRGDLLDTLLSASKAVLTLDCERKPAVAANVIATKGEKGRIAFSAHIDTKPGAPGALDNAGGVAVLLETARRLSEIPDLPVEFVLFNGEDYYSTPGETAYMSDALQQEGRIRAAFNVDGVGLEGSDTTYSFYSETDGFMKTVTGQAADGFVQIEPWPMGDHMLFAYAGIPSAAVTAAGIFALVESVLHTPLDTPDRIDAAKLYGVSGFLERCARAL